jgi:hypothetical protein
LTPLPTPTPSSEPAIGEDAPLDAEQLLLDLKQSEEFSLCMIDLAAKYFGRNRRQRSKIKLLQQDLKYVDEAYREDFDALMSKFRHVRHEVRRLRHALDEARNRIEPEQPIAQPTPTMSAGSTAERDTDKVHVAKGMGRKKCRGKGKAKVERLRDQLVQRAINRAWADVHPT